MAKSKNENEMLTMNDAIVTCLRQERDCLALAADMGYRERYRDWMRGQADGLKWIRERFEKIAKFGLDPS
jgi:hypothetical protein